MLRLGVNIDHVATVRQARRAKEPDPVHAAVLAELGGADGITVHLRGDRRHIQDRDLDVLKQVVRTRLNVEMATTQEMTRIALTVKPDQVTLVPERREEVPGRRGPQPRGDRPPRLVARPARPERRRAVPRGRARPAGAREDPGPAGAVAPACRPESRLARSAGRPGP